MTAILAFGMLMLMIGALTGIRLMLLLGGILAAIGLLPSLMKGLRGEQ